MRWENRGSVYLPVRYMERLAEVKIDASVGSTGNPYDNALAEAINSLYKKSLTALRPLAHYR